MKTLSEMQDEGVSPRLAHLILRPSRERCQRCGDRREQKPDHSVESITTYHKGTYLDEDGAKQRKVKDCYFPLADARSAPRDLCSACRWQSGKQMREEAILRKHHMAVIAEKLLPKPRIAVTRPENLFGGSNRRRAWLC